MSCLRLWSISQQLCTVESSELDGIAERQQFIASTLLITQLMLESCVDRVTNLKVMTNLQHVV